MNADPHRIESLWILPDPWKTLRVSHRSLDGARAPPTGSTGPTTYLPEREPDTIRDAVKLGGIGKDQKNVAPLR